MFLVLFVSLPAGPSPMGVQPVHRNRAPKFQGPRRSSPHRVVIDRCCESIEHPAHGSCRWLILLDYITSITP
jgi:hypothetical protein